MAVLAAQHQVAVNDGNPLVQLVGPAPAAERRALVVERRRVKAPPHHRNGTRQGQVDQIVDHLPVDHADRMALAHTVGLGCLGLVFLALGSRRPGATALDEAIRCLRHRPASGIGCGGVARLGDLLAVLGGDVAHVTSPRPSCRQPS